ncbi:MAG: hypothetical protein EOO09_10000, partial [Chitinophagaceae bacterium]
IWRKLSVGGQVRQLNFELDIYEKLLSFFMPGDYYYYIFNVMESKFDLMSDSVQVLLGFPPAAVTVSHLVSHIHPEDQPYFLNFENKLVNFFSGLAPEEIPNYRVRYDYRIRKADGEYIRILQQVVAIQHDKGAIQRTFGVHTDISHLKTSGAPVLSILGLNGAPSYYDVQVEKKFSTNTSGLTRRELEIIIQLAEGKSSDQIGKLYGISKQTVDTHRKNLLKKTGCRNSVELTSLAVKKGWI